MDFGVGVVNGPHRLSEAPGSPPAKPAIDHARQVKLGFGAIGNARELGLTAGHTSQQAHQRAEGGNPERLAAATDPASKHLNGFASWRHVADLYHVAFPSTILQPSSTDAADSSGSQIADDTVVVLDIHENTEKRACGSFYVIEIGRRLERVIDRPAKSGPVPG